MNERDKNRDPIRDERERRPVDERAAPPARDEREQKRLAEERDRAMRDSLERQRPHDDRPGAHPGDRYDAASSEALLGDESATFRHEWETIQAGFVDEPRRAVEQADALVGRAAQRIAERFSRERQRLEGQWSRGDDVSTEDLRVALRRYRAFFDRLLSI